MSISQFFILSLRGDTIIYRDFRKEMNKGINEIFFHKVNFFESEEKAPPIFNVDGINFIYIKKNELYLVLASLDNASADYFLQILISIMNLIKDLCGVLSEESIRKNFVLIYEIIDEMIDFGYPQMVSTEHIKPFIFTEAVKMMKSEHPLQKLISSNTISSESTKKPIGQDGKKQENEIYVDIIEKITVLFNSSGSLINSSIDGCIKMKSYLKNNPQLALVLNDDIYIGRSGYGTSIEDCNFHAKVNITDFESRKTLYINPPDGEFVAMNYRINSEFAPPFKIYSGIDESDYKLVLRMKIQSNFSDKYYAGNVLIKFNVPKSSQSVYFDLPKNKMGQKVDHIQSENMCLWTIGKFQGGSDHSLTVKMTLQNNNPKECRNELGPVRMSFEIPSFNVSKLSVKELKIVPNDKKNAAKRWVRGLTQANSYVIRIA